jgi:hypothetical protein
LPSSASPRWRASSRPTPHWSRMFLRRSRTKRTDGLFTCVFYIYIICILPSYSARQHCWLCVDVLVHRIITLPVPYPWCYTRPAVLKRVTDSGAVDTCRCNTAHLVIISSHALLGQGALLKPWLLWSSPGVLSNRLQ